MAVQTEVGRLIDEHEQRDAIHIAIAPVVASEKLFPGQDIGLVNGNACVCTKPIGIVDPFLKAPVFPEQRFFMFLYPNTITSLKHSWTHPAFETVKLKSLVDISRQWIERFADQHCETAEVIMDAARGFLETGDYLCRGEKFEGEYVPDEFWHHYEIVTGKSTEGKGSNFFTCSC
jgi:hypothetical protein